MSVIISFCQDVRMENQSLEYEREDIICASDLRDYVFPYSVFLYGAYSLSQLSYLVWQFFIPMRKADLMMFSVCFKIWFNIEGYNINFIKNFIMSDEKYMVFKKRKFIFSRSGKICFRAQDEYSIKFSHVKLKILGNLLQKLVGGALTWKFYRLNFSILLKIRIT